MTTTKNDGEDNKNMELTKAEKKILDGVSDTKKYNNCRLFSGAWFKVSFLVMLAFGFIFLFAIYTAIDKNNLNILFYGFLFFIASKYNLELTKFQYDALGLIKKLHENNAEKNRETK